jgi:hypothetical protein
MSRTETDVFGETSAEPTAQVQAVKEISKPVENTAFKLPPLDGDDLLGFAAPKPATVSIPPSSSTANKADTFAAPEPVPDFSKPARVSFFFSILILCFDC